MSIETAFHPVLSEMTDRWMDLFGYFAPSVVTDTLEEYRAVRETAGLMDFSMLRKVDITGPSAVRFMNRMLTRDLSKVPTGRIAYGALTAADGKMVDDCTASILSDEHVRFCGANDVDAEIFAEHAKGSSIEVRPFTDEMPHLCLQGPSSRRVLQTLTEHDLSNEAFPYYSFQREVLIAGIPVFMTRLGYTAELGYELWVERDRSLELWAALVGAGEAFGVKVIGMDALDLFRIEGGFIIGGIEYDRTVSPYECGLGWSVELSKDDFVGKSALAEAKETTELRLTSVVLEDGGPAATGAEIVVDGTPQGVVTQAVHSPYLGGRTLGLAKLRRPHNAAGVRFVAEVEGREVAGEVVSHPVYDPKRTRAKELAGA
jgi:aminomethyltransferase